MPFGLGFFATAGGAGGGAGSYELIESQILTSNADSITFSSIPQTYKHLQVRLAARSTRSAASSDVIRLRFNGDSSLIYAWHYLSGDGTSVTSASGTDNSSGVIGVIPAANATANNFGTTIIDILDYTSASKNKTAKSLNGFHDSSQSTIDLRSALWASTAAVNSIRINSNIGLLLSGSRFSLYGLKGS